MVQKTHAKLQRTYSRQVRQVTARGNSVRDRGGVAITPQSCTTIQQGQGKRSCGSARQDGTPPVLPSLTRTASQDTGQAPHFGSGQLAHERPSLLRPSATDFSCQHDQSRAALGSRELRIRPVLQAVSFSQGCPVLTGALTSGFPICTHRGHKSGVDGQLGPPKERQPIRDHLQPTTIVRSDSQVQVPDKEIGGNPGPCFPTHPGSGALHRITTTAQHSGSRTRCTVVATRIEWSATPASARSEREGEPETAEQQHPEELRSKASGW